MTLGALLPAPGKHSPWSWHTSHLCLRAPVRAGGRSQAAVGWVPESRPHQSRTERTPPTPSRAPSASELTAAACPETPLTGLGNRLLLDQTKNIQVLNDRCSPLGSELSFMFSEHSSYNLGCFSVLGISPKETYDPEVTWNHEAISAKGASEGLRPQGAVGAGAVYTPPVCLCGRSGNGLRVPGRGNPWGGGDQTSAGNPAGGNSEA